MNRDQKIRREIEQTMQSLDGIERTETDPFFYSRLQERLQNREARIVPVRRIVAAAAVILLIFANVFTVMQYRQAYGDTDAEAIRQENLEAFVQEYELEIPTIYQPNSRE